MIVTVIYQQVHDLDRVRRCHRCYGSGRERSGAVQCPRCVGTGVHPEGYAYAVPDEVGPLALGDVVACPPTPLSAGNAVPATVIGLDAPPPHTPLKSIICRLDEWPEPADEDAGELLAALQASIEEALDARRTGDVR